MNRYSSDHRWTPKQEAMPALGADAFKRSITVPPVGLEPTLCGF